MQDVTRRAMDLEVFDTAGVPDFGIGRRLLQTYAGQPDPDDAAVRRLVTRYEDLLPAALPRREGRVLPNVREILKALANEPGVHSMLLTGNTRRGADAKLRHYALAEFFEGGSFSDGDADRDDIARLALEQALATGQAGDPHRAFVIGDTPHDVRCGQSIAARTIAVATGAYDVASLAATGAWKVLETLPAPAEFLAMLTESEVPADA